MNVISNNKKHYQLNNQDYHYLQQLIYNHVNEKRYSLPTNRIKKRIPAKNSCIYLEDLAPKNNPARITHE